MKLKICMYETILSLVHIITNPNIRKAVLSILREQKKFQPVHVKRYIISSQSGPQSTIIIIHLHFLPPLCACLSINMLCCKPSKLLPRITNYPLKTQSGQRPFGGLLISCSMIRSSSQHHSNNTQVNIIWTETQTT